MKSFNLDGSSIHFIGIAGIGVSALAQLALAKGSTVSGSDPGADPAGNPAIARLKDHGATIFRTHDAANLPEKLDLVVATAAVGKDNPEIKEATLRGIQVVTRAQFLGQIMDAHFGPTVAVAGTHGKTTTTSMIMNALKGVGAAFDYMVGARLEGFPQSVNITDAPVIVCEGDEYPASTLEKRPKFHFLFPQLSGYLVAFEKLLYLFAVGKHSHL